MNSQEAQAVLRMCAGVYPNTEVTSDMVEMWTNGFATTEAQTVAAAVDEWILTNEWWPTIAGIRDVMRGQAAGRRVIAPAGAHCDGTGWIANTDRSSHPCPQCNPVLFGVFDSPSLLRQYRAGTPLSALTDTVKVVSGRMEYEGQMPAGCAVADREDPADPVVSPVRGRQVAAAAYLAECELDGRTPNWSFFDASIGGGRR